LKNTRQKLFIKTCIQHTPTTKHFTPAPPVQIFTIDLPESEFFLSTGQLPVGIVTASFPSNDFAEVSVVGLCVTEELRISNIHYTKITEEEVSERRKGIRNNFGGVVEEGNWFEK